jgi:NADH-quinone oxidoreductase subunit N
VNYFEILRLAAPETVLAITVLLVLALDLVGLRGESVERRFEAGATVSVLGCLLAAVFLFVRQGDTAGVSDMLVVGPQIDFLKVVLLGLTMFTIMISASGRFTDHVGEYLSLVLLGAIGLMLLVSAEDLLMVFISLELASLSLYILTAFNKRNARSAEAALKYFLFGGMSAAFLLFGFSLIYGLAGSTNLHEIAAALPGRELDPLLAVAIVTTVIGFGFKVAAVPFHLWAPDAYEGAPTPSAAFIASGSKVASFYILAKILALGFAGAAGSAVWQGGVPGWTPVLAVVAALSMVLGNLTAIVQTSVKRLLAYSAIAHAGYLLLGVLANTPSSLEALLFYVITYALTVLGAFGVVMVVEEATGGDRLTDFAGLSRRAPLMSFCLLVFLLSLAGIPPLAGFIGKFFVFSAALGADPENLGLLWLVILAIVMSAVSFYYYLQVLKQAYVLDAPENAPAIKVQPVLKLTLILLAVLVVLLGCAPGLLLRCL